MTPGRPGGRAVVPVALGLLVLLTGQDARAHTFGARYDLPLPLDIYLAGAGMVVLLTFVASVVLLRRSRDAGGLWHRDFTIAGSRFGLVVRGLSLLCGALGLFLFGLVLATAFFGSESATRNFAPAFVWVTWWVGLVYVAALITDPWPWLSPWRRLADAVERGAGSLHSWGRRCYPAAAGHWPAVLLFWVFAWLELVSEAGEHPRTLGLLILAYTLLSLGAVLLFGARAWLSHGEVFSVAFAVFGRFAPLRLGGSALRLRVFGHGLLDDSEVPTALMVFVVLMLSTVSFDGFLETPAWVGILDWVVADMTLRPLLLAVREAGVDLLAALKSVALLICPLIFLAVYLLFCRLIALAAGSSMATRRIACAFVFSLVPIAIAYHLAHCYSFLLLAGQLIIPLLSDPFGLGWNLFGTAGYAMDITVVNAKTTWYVALTAIVVGHVIAVLIGHLTALRLFDRPRSAAFSQIPMTVLMVGYTMLSLWILSQPIVESPTL